MNQEAPSTASEGEPESYLSAQEASAAVRELSEADRKRLIVTALFWCRTFRLQSRHAEPEDLLHEAVLRVLNGDRHWPTNLGIVPFLSRVMRSVASHNIESSAHEQESASTAHALDGPGAIYGTGRSGAHPPTSSSESQLLARESLRNLDLAFSNDQPVLEVLRLKGLGMQAAEICAELQLSKRDWEALRKRVLRKLIEHLANGA